MLIDLGFKSLFKNQNISYPLKDGLFVYTISFQISIMICPSSVYACVTSAYALECEIKQKHIFHY